MSLSDPIELTEVKEFIDKGKFHEALQLLVNLKSKNNLLIKENLQYNLLKSTCLSRLGQDEEALALAEAVYQACERSGDLLGMLYSSMIIAESLYWLGRQEKALETIMNSENLLNKIPNLQSNIHESVEASIYMIKGTIYTRKGILERASMNFKRALKLSEKLSNTIERARFLYYFGFFLVSSYELTRGLEYLEEALSLEKEQYNRYLTRIYITIGNIKMFQGDLDRALGYLNRGLEIATKMECRRDIAGLLNNIGNVYYMKGMLNQAKEYYMQSLEILEKLDAISVVAVVLSSLFDVSLELGDIKKAELYLRNIKQVRDREENEVTNAIYLKSKAVMLKTKPRAKNIAKAEEKLKQILEEGIINLEVRSHALLHLCDLYLNELKKTYNIEILDEIQPYITELSDLAEKNFSYLLLGETYILQAKLALIELDFKKARQLLAKGQQIAEKYDLRLIAMKISNEHDELLKELGQWELFKQTKASLEERMKLSRLSEHLEIMIKGRFIAPREIIDEIPVAIVIIAEGGLPIFSQSFEKGNFFKEQLFGGFLTAVNSFCDEIFSEGLDRASFGQYTLLMKSISPFTVCYLFKGKTYPAQRRIGYFVDKFKTENEIWQGFQKFYKTNREVQLEDITLLKHLITEVFIDKKITLV